MVLDSLFLNNKKIADFLLTLNNRQNLMVKGLVNSRLSFFIANIIERLPNNILLVVNDTYHVEQYYEDLIRFLPEERVLIYPEIEVLPHEQIVEDYKELGSRLKVLQELIIFPNKPKILITTTANLLRTTMPPEAFEKYSFHLKSGQEMDLSKLVSSLAVLGYKRSEMVEEAGEFSVRGGIIDIYILSVEKPIRIEFFGDEVDSIRSFDQGSQRSLLDLEEIVIPPSREIIFSNDDFKRAEPVIRKEYQDTIKALKKTGNDEEADYLLDRMNDNLEKLSELNDFPGYQQFLPFFYEKPASLLDYLPEKTGIFINQVGRFWERVRHLDRELMATQATLLEQGSVTPGYRGNFLAINQLIEKLNKYSNILFSSDIVSTVSPIDTSRSFLFTTRGVEPYHGKLPLLLDELKKLQDNKYRVMITLNSRTKVSRLVKYLQEEELLVIKEGDSLKPGTIMVREGSLAEGFIFEDLKLVVFTEKEVFGQAQKKKRQQLHDLEEGVNISSFEELSIGDYVVHENHGVGKYTGVETLDIQGKHQDYLVLQYAGEDKLYVPTEQVNLVQKYIGADQKPPSLYKLGGSEWKKVKQKVKDSVKEMAVGLLELYAERETVEGYSFSKDTVWQQEFEEAFPYEETPDQLQAIKDVKQDMEADTPMDRLLCGDVGYGKTEVAIRAAFKAVMDGKQTAVLVPTTILAQQHYNTFGERMKDYPIAIEMISRFRTPSEQRDVLRRLALGEVDIIIGTHRLLSKDIIFNDLGLLVVDEEQRFGVTHKERLKDFKRSVDVLTLSATPIPRTLHMALVGVRDMSVIETPPQNRYPIRTHISEFNRELVRDAIRKEIGRQGQVYFVHNRVEDIEEKADMIKKLVPEARVAVAHGQMNEHKLEKLMLNFYNNDYDVLVCTTIIETGLDLPNVNTIIVNKAEIMGLAQLYQLRGRVGRSNRVAYAYLLYERDRILPEVAEKRLGAIKEFTNLGSGFKIAMRDLEIRGAGNLLGPEQHGHIATIGFSLYCKLLENAIEELKGQKDEDKMEVEIKLAVDAYIPDDYIIDSKQKIEIYKKIMAVKKEETLSGLIDELIDRFGDPPEVVINLINISKIKIAARKLGINKIIYNNSYIICYFTSAKDIDPDILFRLIDRHEGKIKIRSGKMPSLGIKGKDIMFLEKILQDYIVLSGN